MESNSKANPIGRRQVVLAAAVATAGWVMPRNARAFGQEGAFHPRMLRTGSAPWDAARASAPSRWAAELVRRTSAPARRVPRTVAADDGELLEEPFVLWGGAGPVPPLSGGQIKLLRQFLQLGGVMLVDDFDPASGEFKRGAERELGRVAPESPPARLDPSHVIFKTFYMLDRPVGRFAGPPHAEAIVRGRNAQVIFLSHDLMGALATSVQGGWALDVPNTMQRERAIRFAVNLAMYVLCSDYKDDLVHAQWLMRHRGRREP